ncbi:hypothetical protein [Athalassotoga saccharophila]|uniref:Uncharacterized protein n=1 Tax=Athalassotoga saccharophila TaxID=1441386 RepID=A0A6N4TEN8_9BACT|nr:hypothetical protein [Athalassotoga saccharophila]BBJ29131.1 hypothetical protein ATHSA_p20041 [Athalassotoga saccharophila]
MNILADEDVCIETVRTFVSRLKENHTPNEINEITENSNNSMPSNIINVDMTTIRELLEKRKVKT